MKYKPRHPLLNMVCAAACFVGGLILVAFGLLDLKSPNVWNTTWGDVDSSTFYGVVFGGLWATLGGIGVAYHIKYFRAEAARRRKHSRAQKIYSRRNADENHQFPHAPRNATEFTDMLE